MQRFLETEIKINKPVSSVWNVLMDFEAYPQWNSFVSSIEGKPVVGSELVVKLKPGETSSGMTFKPRVVTCEKEKKFAWLGRLFFSGLFDGQHTFELKALDANTTLLKQYEQFNGYLVPLIFWSIGESTKAGFNRMNEALKARCEQLEE